MANTKEYKIVINGLTESINAVDALNKQLDALDNRINVLQAKSINIGKSLTGAGKGSSKSSLSEEEKILRNIEKTEEKIKTYSKDVYQNYLAAKDILKETLNDQKQIAAQERLQANNYTNTMRGLKDKLADIKNVMQTTDIGSDIFKKYTKEANEITQKLKELEEAYGQFGRNVGNYKSAAEGFEKIKVAVGGTVREYDNYRQAAKTLKQERFQLANSVGQEAQAYKDVDIALKKLESDYADLNKSSAFMDDMLDTMQSFTSIAGIGVGLSQLFGIDDSDFQESMTRLASLLVVLKSIETLIQQIQKDEGLFAKMFNRLEAGLDSVFSSKKATEIGTELNLAFAKFLDNAINGFSKLRYHTIGETKALKEMLALFDNPIDAAVFENSTWSSFDKKKKEAEYVNAMNFKIAKQYEKEWETAFDGFINWTVKGFKFLSKSLLAIFSAGIMFFLPELLEGITNFIKSLDTAKAAAERAAEGMKALNRQLEIRKDLLGASLLKGEINDEQYLKGLYDAQTKALEEQIKLLRARADAAKDNGVLGTGLFKHSENADFSGNKLTGETTVSSGLFGSLEITVKKIEEVEKAWKNCQDTISEGQDYLTRYGKGVVDWFYSLFVTVKDTEGVMKGLGNVRLSDFIANFDNVNKQFKSGKIDAKQYAAELAKLRKELNSNEVLNSVIANLDKYIPDEGVREAVQNIINEIQRLDDAFNMTSAQQVHYWEQVRIDAMKDGWEKTKAQIENNRRYEVKETALTEEQKNLVNAKYQRQYLDALEKHNKEVADKAKAARDKERDAENQLIALRIQNMREGFEKRMAELENERRLELQKVKENGIKVGELSVEINKKYDQKILEEKRKWAFDTLKIYEDLAAKIDQVNRSTFETEASTASQNVQTRAAKQQQDTGFSMINPSNYSDTKAFEEYYKRLVEIKKNAVDKELTIEKERLEKTLEYSKKEEKLRHSRLVDANGGEYATQLRAGLITQEQYDKLIEDENDAHYAKMNALDKEYLSNLSATTQSSLEETQKIYSDYYGNVINGLRSDKSKVDEIISKQPITDKAGWGVVNIGKTSNNYNTALAQYDDIKNSIIQKQKELDDALKAKQISAEDFAIRRSDLDAEMKAIDQAVENVKDRQKDLIGEFINSIQMYIQAGLQGINDLMNTIWDAQDSAHEKEMEDLEKQIKAQEDLYNKQKDLAEEHKNNLNDIEDELSTARGDRRQHLIDQLNAEMAAQRQAVQEQKKAEKEQEKLEKKKEREEIEQKKREKKRQVISAIISAALATVNGLATQPFMPVGIAMGALAAALGAAQVAIISSQKYADGGVIDGPSHARGGVKVLGGTAEVEGQEFITNKRTTSQNVDLLYYINSKKKKLDLSDFIEFYASGKTTKNISPTRRVFADGGQIPTLRGDIDINSRLLTAFEDYSNRPVQVAVVDINERQAAVRNVQVMAGLEN